MDNCIPVGLVLYRRLTDTTATSMSYLDERGEAVVTCCWDERSIHWHFNRDLSMMEARDLAVVVTDAQREYDRWLTAQTTPTARAACVEEWLRRYYPIILDHLPDDTWAARLAQFPLFAVGCGADPTDAVASLNSKLPGAFATAALTIADLPQPLPVMDILG